MKQEKNFKRRAGEIVIDPVLSYVYPYLIETEVRRYKLGSYVCEDERLATGLAKILGRRKEDLIVELEEMRARCLVDESMAAALDEIEGPDEHFLVGRYLNDEEILNLWRLLEREPEAMAGDGKGCGSDGLYWARLWRWQNLIFLVSLVGTSPPRSAQFLLLLIPKRNREHLIGDLEEEYRTIVLPEYGRFWAGLWYWGQTLGAIGPYLWSGLKRVLGWAAIAKLIGG